MGLPRTYEIASSVVSHSVGTETVVVDLASEACFGLDRVGSVIWAELENRTAVAAMAGILVNRFEVSADRAAADVRELLGQLDRAGLIRKRAGCGS